jgi:hypothetical protein
MNVLFICAFQPRYLDWVLGWLALHKVPEKYQIIVWDNGGAAEICARHKISCFSMKDQSSGKVTNVGKALGMHHLIDISKQHKLDIDCYVCMDDDVITDRPHLDALAAAAMRPGLGMIGAMFHPFNTTVPGDGTLQFLDPCRHCRGTGASPGAGACAACQGSGKDPRGLCLRVYPREERLLHNHGKVAGTLFAVARGTVERLPWAPYMYPIMYNQQDGTPVVYWGEDATLDVTLTSMGFLNGYVESPTLTPALHLPELNRTYQEWKMSARTSGFARGQCDRDAQPKAGESTAR